MQSVKTVDKVLRGVLAVLLVFFLGAVAKAVYDPPPHVVIAGERAPEFTISTDNGRTISVPKFGGKYLVVNFWATWCPPCVQETPSLSKFAADYGPRGVVVLGISVDSNQKAYDAFLQRYKPQFLTVRDAKIHRDYGTFMYPESYIIDSSGKVVHKIAQGADWSSPNIRSFFDSQL